MKPNCQCMFRPGLAGLNARTAETFAWQSHFSTVTPESASKHRRLAFTNILSMIKDVIILKE